MSYLTLTKRIMHNELSNAELIECLEISNVPVIQHTILKLIEKEISSEYVLKKLLEYSEYMDAEFKVLGLCKIGHLAIYALQKLNFIEDYQILFEKLSEEDREQVVNLYKAFEQM